MAPGDPATLPRRDFETGCSIDRSRNLARSVGRLHNQGVRVLRGGAKSGRRVMLNPMLRDLQPAAHPHLLVAEHVVDEARQGVRPPRSAAEAAMQADRHHLRLAFPLEIETVEGGLEIVEEIVARHPAGVGRELEVIRVERIGGEQTRLASDGRPIGESSL